MSGKWPWYKDIAWDWIFWGVVLFALVLLSPVEDEEPERHGPPPIEYEREWGK